MRPHWWPLPLTCVSITLFIPPRPCSLINFHLPPLIIILSKCLEMRTNNSYAPFNVSGYSSLPKKSDFLIYSNSCTYLDSSNHSKNKITLNFSSSVVTSYGVAVALDLSIVLKLHRICSPPSSINFCSRSLNLSKYSSFVSVGP